MTSPGVPPLRVLIVFGTRPEAIKLCVLVKHLQARPERFWVKSVVTAQHRKMLDQVLAVFQVEPDYDLDLMTDGQTIHETTTRVLNSLAGVLSAERPDVMLVQGDTTTTFAAALAAFYARIPVTHVEAGLRTGDPYSPFPEEMNRLLTTRLSCLHFAATVRAAENLQREGVPSDRVHVTGNTVIDAAQYVRDALLQGRIPRPAWPFLDPRRKLILLTTHRRESFGRGLESIFHAVRTLAERPDVQVVFPVHRNPEVRTLAQRMLEDHPNIHLLEPLEYGPFIDLMTRSHLILTDSGGVQEEAPALGKPVLVLRENTERPEAIEAGAAVLVGTDPARICLEASRLLDDRARHESMSRRRSPFGDGKACERIADALAQYADRIGRGSSMADGRGSSRVQEKRGAASA